MHKPMMATAKRYMKKKAMMNKGKHKMPDGHMMSDKEMQSMQKGMM